MIFTREDILKIQNALLQLGRKDSEFKDANTPLNSDDEITILQDGINKKVSINNLLSTLGLLKKDDFINVSDRYDEYYIHLSEAITIIANNKRKKGLVITFQDIDGNWRIYQFIGELSNFIITDYWKDLHDFKYPIINTVLPDEEDLTLTYPNIEGNSFIKLKDKEYNLDNFSGLGKVILRKNIVEVEDPTYGKITKNILYQDMINKSNTIYVIQYDFTLGENITIPDNCILDFNGGSISGANTLTGTNTRISARNMSIFGNNINISGSWLVPDIYSNWFVDATQNNILKKILKFTSNDIHNNIYIADGIYQLSALTDTRETVLTIDTPNTDVYCSGFLNLSPNGFYGYNIVTISADNVKWHGGFITGDAKNHDYSTHQDDGYKTHEWGFGIVLTGSNCTIEDVNISLCTGDGIVVKGDSVSNRIIGIIISKCRRQGITVANTKNLIINNFDINNIGDFVYENVSIVGSLPKSAIDIEPDPTSSMAENITIKNGIINDCITGIMAYRAKDSTKNNNICIENIIINASGDNIAIYNSKNVNINNIIGNNIFRLEGTELSDINNSRFKSFVIYKCDNYNKISNSIFNDVNSINDSSINFYKCEFSLFNSISNNVSVVLDNCRIVTSETTINYNASSPFKFVAKNTIFEKNVEGASVGNIYVGGNVDFKFEDCSFYMKSNTHAVMIKGSNDIKSVIFVNCEAYRYKNEEYVLFYDALTDILDSSIIFEKKEYLYGSTRPIISNKSVGHRFFDTTIGKPIYWTGGHWVDATGTEV